MEKHLQLGLLGLIFFVAYSLLFRSRSKSNQRFPPSPAALPLLGHLHLLGKLPHISLLQLAQKHGGFMYLKLGQVNTLIVSSADAAKEVLKTQDHVFASRPRISSAKYFGYEGAGIVMAPYGEGWRQRRKLCTLELLTSKRVDMFQPVRRSEMSIFMQEVLTSSEGKIPFNLTAKLKDLTFNSMAKMVVSKSYSAGASSDSERQRAQFFNETITAGFKVAGGLHISDFIPWLSFLDTQVSKIKILQSRQDEFLQKEVDHHRAAQKGSHEPAKDFMDVMLSTGELTDTSIKALSLDMIAAATDTAAVVVDWAMAELMKNPSMMKKAQEELHSVVGKGQTLEESDLHKLEYLNAIVKETLRLHPPVPLLLPRESIQSCEIAGFHIPPKTRVIVNAYAIARDPKVWQEPTKFDPERFIRDNSIDVRGQSFELLPFGSGRRSCPGMLLGMTNVQYILGSLLHGFEWKPVRDDLVNDMSEEFGLTVTRAAPLILLPSKK